MTNCIHCHQPQSTALVICPKCYGELTVKTVSMDDKELIEELTECAQRCDKNGVPHMGDTMMLAVSRIKTLTAQLSESERQRAAAVEDLRGLCWCCAHGKKWDKAPDWSNMTTCEHIRERGALAVVGGKAGKSCPHWKWRGPQEAGEGEKC